MMIHPSDTSSAPTIAHLLGEMTWLLTQSPLHRGLALADLEWLAMPALLNRQFYLFRDGAQTIGLALWAKCNAEAAAKLERGILDPQNRLTPEDWTSGDDIWLIDLVAPFANPENRQREIMIADLISGPLQGQEVKLHISDPVTGKRRVQVIAATAGQDLKKAVEEILGQA